MAFARRYHYNLNLNYPPISRHGPAPGAQDRTLTTHRSVYEDMQSIFPGATLIGPSGVQEVAQEVPILSRPESEGLRIVRGRINRRAARDRSDLIEIITKNWNPI
jgi:hypothetical protein